MTPGRADPSTLARCGPRRGGPARPSGYSLPSGHAGGAAAVYGSLVLLAVPLLRRWARVLLWAARALLVAAVAASRVLLGVTPATSPRVWRWGWPGWAWPPRCPHCPRPASLTATGKHPKRAG
jgi:hypothetical protein